MKLLLEKLNKNKHFFKNDSLAWITVALALIPEAVAFAFVAWVTPLLSLQTAFIMALVAAIFTWRPWMISSSTAAISIVLAPLIATYWLEYLFATVVLIWIIQLALWFLKVWKFTSLIPQSVVLGFLNWLAIVIFLAQFEQFKIDQTVIINWIETIQKVWMPILDIIITMWFIFLTMLIIHFFPRITKAVPSTLVWIATVTVISIILSKFWIYDLRTVQDFAWEAIKWWLPGFHIPQVEITFEFLKIIFPYALVAALVWLTEATLTLRVLDEMTDTKWKMNREYWAQGIANFVTWFFGWMWWDAMVWQSIINVKSWWRTRFSWIVAAIALIIFIMFLSPIVNAIPLASLIWLMFMVVISTFAWESFKYNWKIPKSDIAIIAIVSFLTIFFDLATAVIWWIVIATLVFAWEKWKSLKFKTFVNKDWYKVYKLEWVLFFASILNFKDFFDVKNDPKKIILDLKYTKVKDYSWLDAINTIAEKYKKVWKEFLITRPWENCKLLIKNAENVLFIKVDENYDPTK